MDKELLRGGHMSTLEVALQWRRAPPYTVFAARQTVLRATPKRTHTLRGAGTKRLTAEKKEFTE
jgi:hypothetical protein